MSAYTKDNPGREYIAGRLVAVWEEDGAKYLAFRTDTHLLTMSSADQGETIAVSVSLTPNTDASSTPTLTYTRHENGYYSFRAELPSTLKGERSWSDLYDLAEVLKETAETADVFGSMASEAAFHYFKA